LGAVYDVIVAGVGASGSAVACELARRGSRVLGLDRFSVPNDRSSHHGLTRIIRLAYFEGAAYVPFVRRAHELWRRLERDTGESILTVTGSLDAGPPGSANIESAAASCRVNGLDHEVLDGGAIGRRFPGYAVPADWRGVYQPDGGFLASEAAVAAHAGLARRFGAEIRTGERVLGWEPKGDGVAVRTEAGTYEAGHLVVSAGPWVADLVPELKRNLVPLRQVVCWFEIADPDAFAPSRFPVFVVENEEGTQFYGFPEWGAPGFKIGCHYHLREATDPDALDRTLHARDEDLLRSCVARFFPAANGRVLDHRACIYTNAPDEDFVIDRLPGFPQVVVASACSGHGFKFAPAVGEAVADLVGQGRSRHDLDRFRLSRLPSHA
jgi:sarcosine oxidase